MGGPVHPHTRGDITMHGQAQYLEAGSPPHAWGHPKLLHYIKCATRFTPTRVGTSSAFSPCISRSTVHPHTRGDIVIRLQARAALRGSPPHAWGHHWMNKVYEAFARFTPTRVGTSLQRSVGASATPVHPHTRGDIKISLSIFCSR